MDILMSAGRIMKNADESEIYVISADQRFNFGCGPGLSCFNACCRDLNQYLSPYDVFRLRKNLSLSSSVFLETYTLRHDGPASGLPVVTLKPGPPPDLICPFVSPEGCMVYEDRPASCRMYPVMRMAGRDRITGKIREEYRLISEPHCGGFSAERLLTVDQWMKEQGLYPYNTANDAFIEVLAVKRNKCAGMLPKEISDRIYTALYDSDRFVRKLNGMHDPANEAAYEAAYLDAAYAYVIDTLNGLSETLDFKRF
jgi:uncharacterized protein